ncbi:MAG: hypothetical protein NZ761_08945, partial [Dehalococcoidia bacterium]|nr:hypothetical protein [Dehalococcoidia bacterium]
EILPEEEPALPPPASLPVARAPDPEPAPVREKIQQATRQAEQPAPQTAKESGKQENVQRLVKQRLRELAERYGVDYRFVVALVQDMTGKSHPRELVEADLEGAAQLLARHAEGARAIAAIAAEYGLSPRWVEEYLAAQGCAATLRTGEWEFVAWYLLDEEDIARAREAARQHAEALMALMVSTKE